MYASLRSASLFPLYLTLGALTTLLLGCASSQPAPSEPVLPPSAEAFQLTPAEVEARLRAKAQAWDGVPHRLGGTSRRGVDCSAFVQMMYRTVLGLNVPRTTAHQMHIGEPVSRRALQPGDLVFFSMAGKQRHVGIYLSRNEFAHASSSQGVTVSDLSQSYWQRSYQQARRLLPEAPPPATASATTPDRVGW